MKFHKIQALRAIAAILVAIDHTLTFLVGHPYASTTLTPVAWFLGEQGVAIFFVISGFIMTCTTVGKSGSWVSAALFVKHRCVRVIPMYWLFTLLAAALIGNGVWLKGLTVSGADLVRSLAFIPYGNGHRAMRPLLGQGWTLNYEILFYLLFAGALIFSRRVGLTLVVAVLLAMALAGVYWGTSLSGADPVTVTQFYTGPLLMLFVVGIAIGELAQHGRGSALVVPIAWIGRRGLAVTTLGVALSACLFASLLNTYRIALPWRLAFWAVDGSLVLICAMAPTAQAGGRIEAIWERLGDASYSIYLAHFFAITAVAKFWGLVLHWHMPALFLLAGPLAGIAAGLFTYQVVERPLTRTLRRLTDRPAPIVAVPVLAALPVID